MVSGAGTCPNGKWTATVEDVDFTSAELLIYQGGDLVLTDFQAL